MMRLVNPVEINRALGEIEAEMDPTAKHLRLASLVAAVFREDNIDLVIVGGSAIEFYTDGAYVSGDVDMCLVNPIELALRKRQEMMGRLGAIGGPRSWRVGGLFVDLLGRVESVSVAAFDRLQAPYGPVQLIGPEELLAERVLISVYPQAYAPAADCARKLVAVALRGQVEVDWDEVRRIAQLPEYDVFSELCNLAKKVAHELGVPAPYHP